MLLISPAWIAQLGGLLEAFPFRDLVRVHVELWVGSANVFPPLMAEMATLSWKPGCGEAGMRRLTPDG